MLLLPLVILFAVYLVYYVAKYFYSTAEAWRFLLRGRQMLLEQAKLNGDRPFSVQLLSFGGRMHVMSTKQHWIDLSSADGARLSIHAWAKLMHQPQYALATTWPEVRQEEGMPFIRAIRTMTKIFPVLEADIAEIIKSSLEEAIKKAPKRGKYSVVPLVSLTERLMTRVNTLLVLGKEPVKDEAFITHALNYTHEAVLIGELVRLVPDCLATFVATIVKGRNLNQTAVLDKLVHLVDERRTMNKSGVAIEPRSVVSAFVDYSGDAYSTSEMVKHLNVLYITTCEVFPIVSAQLMQDLYTHSSYIPELQRELEDPIAHAPQDGKPTLMDACIMESIRTNCLQSTSIHRIALKPFTFSDGYTVPVGESIGFHQHKIFLDEDAYPEPLQFKPERYLDTRRAPTDVGMEWAFWGSSKNACPGRFYATFTVKVLMRCLIEQFDCEMKVKGALNLEWRENTVPKGSTILLIKKRYT